MDKEHYSEMLLALSELEQEHILESKRIFLFGYCKATEELADLFLLRGYEPVAILDNNVNKHGITYRGIKVKSPETILEEGKDTIVCIVARAYAAMSDQLKRLGYKGEVRKLIDYNSYADYSLSEETMVRMREREKSGEILLYEFNKRHSGMFKFLCPFSALGDIYIMMSYLPVFMQKKGLNHCAIGVIGEACAEVVKLFGNYAVESFAQNDMDRMIQAALYMEDKSVFIPHQDRPYVVNLHKVLYVKQIPLEQIYCCGVFGLPKETVPVRPKCFKEYDDIDNIPHGNAVILSPYAKSVTALPQHFWDEIVMYCKNMGKKCFTNVSGDEEPLKGTIAISPQICEIKSVVERAGMFVGIRSGLCDVLREANAQKIALYPDYNYCDTQWKAIDMYSIDGWNNIVVNDDINWEEVL